MKELNEDQYWAIIQDSITTTDNQDDQQQALIATLQALPPADIIGFYLRTVQLLNATYTSEMWCAGTLINTRCSDDGFEDFRCWIISRGKDAYENAKQNPDSLVNELIEDLDIHEFELFGYVATEAYEEATGEDLLDALADNSEGPADLSFTPIEFNWNRNDPESMKQICPNLYQRFKG